MRWAGHVTRMGERRVVYSVLVEKPEGTRQFGRPRPKWEDNTEMIFRKWVGSMDWIDLAQNRDG